MKTRHHFIVVVFILGLSILGMTLWLFEIHYTKGWYSLKWLKEPMHSPYVVALIASITFLIPLLVSKQVTAKKIGLAIFILYVVNLIGYEFGRILNNELYLTLYSWTVSEMDLGVIFLLTAVLLLLMGLAYWVTTNYLITRKKWINILLITLLIALTVPLSLLTIYLNQGWGTSRGWVDAIKMGYPVFWIVFCIGTAGLLLARKS